MKVAQWENEQSRADDPKARSLYSSSFYYLNPSILKGGDDERTQMKLDRHYRFSPQCGFQSANMNQTTLTNETALPQNWGSPPQVKASTVERSSGLARRSSAMSDRQSAHGGVNTWPRPHAITISPTAGKISV